MKPFVYGSWSVAMKQLEGVSAVDWVSVCQGSLEQFQGSAVVFACTVSGNLSFAMRRNFRFLR